MGWQSRSRWPACRWRPPRSSTRTTILLRRSRRPRDAQSQGQDDDRYYDERTSAATRMTATPTSVTPTSARTSYIALRRTLRPALRRYDPHDPPRPALRPRYAHQGHGYDGHCNPQDRPRQPGDRLHPRRPARQPVRPWRRPRRRHRCRRQPRPCGRHAGVDNCADRYGRTPRPCRWRQLRTAAAVYHGGLGLFGVLGTLPFPSAATAVYGGYGGLATAAAIGPTRAPGAGTATITESMAGG
jgi:hypothetical protein